MKQSGTQKFASEDGKFTVVCDNSLSLGILHDYLLELKGTVVEMILAAQKQEKEASEKVKEADAKKAEEATPEAVKVVEFPVETE